MPIYEYECENCGERFEEIVLGDRDAAVECPGCGSLRTARQMSTFAWSGGDGSGSPSACSSCGASGAACKTCGH